MSRIRFIDPATGVTVAFGELRNRIARSTTAPIPRGVIVETLGPVDAENVGPVPGPDPDPPPDPTIWDEAGNSFELSNAGLTAKPGAAFSQTIYGDVGRSVGKYYIEFEMAYVGDGHSFSVGLQRQGAPAAGIYIGGSHTLGFPPSQTAYVNGANGGNLSPPGNVLMLAIDLDAETCSVGANGVWSFGNSQGGAGSVGAQKTYTGGGILKPSFQTTLYESGAKYATCTLRANASDMLHKNMVGPGFLAWDGSPL